MEESKLKNMVVLKNLPSNLVEEAIIVLKSNKNAKKLEKVDKDKNSETTTNTRKAIEKDFIVKEAEMLVSTYISKIENSKKEIKKTKIENTKKIVRLKNYALLSSIVIFIQLLLLIIK